MYNFDLAGLKYRQLAMIGQMLVWTHILHREYNPIFFNLRNQGTYTEKIFSVSDCKFLTLFSRLGNKVVAFHIQLGNFTLQL